MKKLALAAFLLNLGGAAIALASTPRELEDLAQDLSSQLSSSGAKTVAVLNFQNEDYTEDFSHFVVQRLNILLSRSEAPFSMVTRDQLEAILSELDLRVSDRFDSSASAKIGKHLGAQALIVGSFTVFTSEISLATEVFDVESAQITGGSIADIPRTANLESLLRKRLPHEPGTPGDAPVEATHVEYGRDLTFTLLRCTHSGSKVSCGYVLERTGPNASFRTGPFRVRAIDPTGQEYSCAGVFLGVKSAESTHSQFTADLVTGVPLRGRVVFNAIPTDVAALAALEVQTSTEKFLFRQVALN